MVSRFRMRGICICKIINFSLHIRWYVLQWSNERERRIEANDMKNLYVWLVKAYLFLCTCTQLKSYLHKSVLFVSVYLCRRTPVKVHHSAPIQIFLSIKLRMCDIYREKAKKTYKKQLYRWISTGISSAYYVIITMSTCNGCVLERK